MGQALAALLICALLTFAPGAQASEAPISWPQNLRTAMDRLADVEWRLLGAAGASCPSQSPAIGATFDDLSAYPKSDWPVLRSALGMSNAPQIAHVAAGSPAALAGLEAEDDLVAIGGETAQAMRADTQGAQLIVDRIDARIAALAVGEAAALTIRRAGAFIVLHVVPVSRCSARFVVKTGGGLDAYSDGTNIAITARMISFTQSNDELALLAGHELGHVIGGDRKSSKLTTRRTMERLADERGAQAATCAGYDVPRALGFWARLEKQDRLSWLGDPSHGSAKARMETMRGAAQRGECPH